MAVKVCVVLSPSEGPQAMARALRHGIPEDAAWVVVQRHATGEDLETLAECMEEIAGRPTLRLGSEPVPLHGGVLCLAGEGVDMRLEGHRLMPQGKNQTLDLDAFLVSLAELAGGAEVAILPGRESRNSGLEGMLALQKREIRIWTSGEDNDAEGWAVRLMGSGIRIERRPLEALFESTLPRSGTVSPGRLLIADDDPKTRELLGELCRLRGYACDFATDGLDVLRLLRKGAYAGLILDIHMPELDGLQTLERLRAEKPGLSVLVVTGEADPEVLDKVKALGAKGVLTKSFTPDQFQRALNVFGPAGSGSTPTA